MLLVLRVVLLFDFAIDELGVRSLEPLARQVIDMSGHIIIPGFIDMHVHVTGGGGMSFKCVW